MFEVFNIVLLIVFDSLTKDMTGKEDVYRGPAIRALCRITDVILAFPHSFSSPSFSWSVHLFLFHFTVIDHNAAGHREIHETGHRGQGAERLQFSIGLLTGKLVPSRCAVMHVGFQLTRWSPSVCSTW